MTRLVRILLLSTSIISLIVSLVGCETPNAPLTYNYLQDKKQKIVIVTIKADNPTFYQNQINGRDGLLVAMVNDAMMNSLTKTMKQADITSYYHIGDEFGKQFSKRHFDAIVYPRSFYDSQLDYRTIAPLYHANRVLVLRAEAIGAARDYDGIMAVGDPYGYCILTADLYNASGIHLFWHYRATIKQKVTGKFEQPPYYPHLHQATMKAINSAKQELIDKFFSVSFAKNYLRVNKPF